MDNKHRPRSIDGFSGRSPNVPRKPALSSSSLDNFKRSVQKKPVSPQPRPLNAPRTTRIPVSNPVNKKPSFNANPQQNGSSLLNMNIPNPSYTSALNESKSQAKDKSKRSKKPWSRKRKIWTTILVVLVLFFGVSAWFGSRILGSIDKVFHGNIFSDAQAIFSSSTLKGESTGHVNILVAGDSADDPGHDGADLTDSIMLVSIDTQNHTAFMLSIPRDLWVYIPGLNSYQKINAANNVTNFSASGYPNGGMGALSQVVQNDLGIPVDYYALVNYGAFRDSVNAVGGITVDIQSPDPRGVYDPGVIPRLPNGMDNLNGVTALGLARSRGDQFGSYGFPESDYTRTMYQRLMVEAILKKATTIGVVSNPIKVTSLFKSLSSNVQTNLSLQDVLTLEKLTKGLNISNIGSDYYSSSLTGSTTPLLTSYTDPASGQEALIPAEGLGNYGALKAYYQQLVSSNPVTKEGASIEVLNATNVTGLAKQAENAMQTKGIVNIGIADSSVNYPTSMIIDNDGTSDPQTLALLKKMLPNATVVNNQTSTEAKQAANYTNDNFVVVLGQDYANANPIASNTAGSNTSSGSNTSN